MDSSVIQVPPQLDLELFGDASLRDPFSDYRRIRDAAPLVRLGRPDVYAIGRFDDVQAALRAHDALISGEGVGFSDAFNAPKGMNVIASDGELHIRLRSTVMRPLAPAKLREARAELKAMMAARVASLRGAGPFDAMKALAAFLPVEAVSHLVGLPLVGRERMLDWAAATFNLIGPDLDSNDLVTLAESRSFMAGLSEETVRSGSWAGDLLAAGRTGRLTMVEATAALSAYIVPSLDTTILAKGHLLSNLASEPEQWKMLKEKPELIPSAVLEGVRKDAVIRWFSRVAATDYQVADYVLPKGARVMLLYGSANRDERHYRDPERYDILRDARDHLAWGAGAHMCAGMHLARIEMEVLLETLVEADVHLIAEAPQMGVNRGLFGFTNLPFRLDVA